MMGLCVVGAVAFWNPYAAVQAYPGFNSWAMHYGSATGGTVKRRDLVRKVR